MGCTTGKDGHTCGSHPGKDRKEFVGDLQGWPQRMAIANFGRKVTFALITFIDKQLTVTQDVLLEDTRGEAHAATGPGIFRGRVIQPWVLIPCHFGH